MGFLTVSFQIDVCAEVKVLSQLHHKHLVNLCGYCEEKGEFIELAITVLCIWIMIGDNSIKLYRENLN